MSDTAKNPYEKIGGGKRYLTQNYMLREKFGCKVMKISLNAGFTCPIYTKDYLVNLHSKIYDEKEGCAFIYGYGDYGYSFTCLFNLVDFIAALLNLNSSSNYQGIYNICDSKPIQAKDIVEYERSNHLLGTSGIVMQRNYGADSVKTSVFGLLGNKAAKTDYRYNDLSVACSNISYDNTKAQRISSFRWKLSNTK